MSEFCQDNSFPLVDALVKTLRQMPKPEALCVNSGRLEELNDTAEELKAFFQKFGRGWSLTTGIDTMFDLGYITVEMDECANANARQLGEQLSRADKVEIYPLVNGKLRLELAFHRIRNFEKEREVNDYV